MKIKLEGGVLPTRGHQTDAGLDLYAPCDAVVPAMGRETIMTGVCIQLPEGMVGLVKSRSGLMTKQGLTTDGVIDEGYTGQIGVCLFNHTLTDYQVKAGERIAQLVILPCSKPELTLVENLDDSLRSEKGFGSTGK